MWRQKALAASVAVSASWAMLLVFSVGGERVLNVLSRIAGIILFAIAVDFVLDGTRAFLEGTRFG